jgi:hypothetical protein
MPELIDKSAVIDSVYSATERIIIAVEEESPEIADILVNARNAILKKIERQPTIEPEVRHGRWIDKGDYAVCTECGGESGTQYDGVEPIPLMTQFCPHCGAKMNGGADNGN